MLHEINRIQSKIHNVGLYRNNKINMSPYNDKKFILKAGYSRLLHFHKSAR